MNQLRTVREPPNPGAEFRAAMTCWHRELRANGTQSARREWSPLARDSLRRQAVRCGRIDRRTGPWTDFNSSTRGNAMPGQEATCGNSCQLQDAPIESSKREQRPAQNHFVPGAAVLVVLQLLGSLIIAQERAIPVSTMEPPSRSQATGVSIRTLLPGEIPEVVTDCLSIVGPARHSEPSTADRDVVWLFVHGKALLQTKDKTYSVDQETIARAPLGWPWTIEVQKGETLLAVRIRKQLSDSDRIELTKYPENNGEPYVRKFAECTPYTEAIKSPKTVSRTLFLRTSCLAWLSERSRRRGLTRWRRTPTRCWSNCSLASRATIAL